MRHLITLTVALALLGGVAVAQDPPRLGIYFDPAGEGIVVEEVMPDTPAARAGLKVGDRIARFGGERIVSDADLLGALGKVKKGEAVTLQIVRDGKEIELPVTFGVAKPTRSTRAIPAIPLAPMKPTAAKVGAASGELGELDGVLARALESLEGTPGVGEIARARVLLRKARQQLKEITAAHPAPMAAPPIPSAPSPPVEPEGMMGEPGEGMDFTKLTARIEELMGSGKSPEEVQKIIADEFPGIQVMIDVEGMEEEIEEVPEPAEPTKPTTKPTKKAGAGK